MDLIKWITRIASGHLTIFNEIKSVCQLILIIYLIVFDKVFAVCISYSLELLLLLGNWFSVVIVTSIDWSIFLTVLANNLWNWESKRFWTYDTFWFWFENIIFCGSTVNHKILWNFFVSIDHHVCNFLFAQSTGMEIWYFWSLWWSHWWLLNIIKISMFLESSC